MYLNKITTIDTHCDTPLQFLRKSFDIGDEHTPPERRGSVQFILGWRMVTLLAEIFQE